MSIPRKILKMMDQIVKAAGLKDGQTNTAPRSGIRYYVLSPNHKWFLDYVRLSGRKLQDCKCISSVDDMRGIGFSSPLVELVVLKGWDNMRHAKHRTDREFAEAGYELISRYCRDKRVHSAPMEEV